jgi:hypothetical protein
MNPFTVINALSAALTLANELAPAVQQLRQSGAVTPEQQAELQAKFDALRAADAFAAPHWQPSTGA